MSTADLVSLLPFLVLSLSIVVILLTIGFFRNHGLIFWMTIAASVLSFVGLLGPMRSCPGGSGKTAVTALLSLDPYAIFYIGLILISTAFVAWFSRPYLQRSGGAEESHEEYYLLLLTATLGASILAASAHFASFFLGLEILSVSLYSLISYPRSGDRRLEASVKYLVLAGVSSTVLLLGMALIYYQLGTMEFLRMSQGFRAGASDSALLVAGSAFILVGIGFKLALTPFHMWAPDVYEGAPAPVTAYIATVSKAAVFAVLLRYVLAAGLQNSSPIFIALSVLAIASMTIGNLLALRQKNIKRLLAYSSTAHLGYLLIALLAGPLIGAQAVIFYFVAYIATTLAAFGVVTAMSSPDREMEDLEDYRGLFSRSPVLASILTVALLSLAGIPLTAGFIGKFYVVAAGIGSHLWLLVLVLAANSGIGLFYYLRVLFILAADEPTSEKKRVFSHSFGPSVALVALAAIVIWLGVFPSPIVRMVQAAVVNLGR